MLFALEMSLPVELGEITLAGAVSFSAGPRVARFLSVLFKSRARDRRPGAPFFYLICKTSATLAVWSVRAPLSVYKSMLLIIRISRQSVKNKTLNKRFFFFVLAICWVIRCAWTLSGSPDPVVFCCVFSRYHSMTTAKLWPFWPVLAGPFMYLNPIKIKQGPKKGKFPCSALAFTLSACG